MINLIRSLEVAVFAIKAVVYFFTINPTFAADAAEKSASGGYAFNPQAPTNTPFVSKVEILNDNIIFATEAIPSSVAKQIGIINGINPSKYPSYDAFLYDLQQSYLKDKLDFSDLFEAQDKAAEALHKKGITGHVVDGNEIVIYDESDIIKKEQTRIYKNDSELISDQYHKAKADGSNPELVKAVETTPKLSEEEKAKDNKAAEADGLYFISVTNGMDKPEWIKIIKATK